MKKKLKTTLFIQQLDRDGKITLEARPVTVVMTRPEHSRKASAKHVVKVGKR